MFKVGDRVRWVSTAVRPHWKGRIGTVVELSDAFQNQQIVDVLFDVDSYIQRGWFATRFELVTKTKETEMVDVTYRLIDDTQLVVVIDYGKPYEINATNKNFYDVKDLLESKMTFTQNDVKQLENLLSDIKRVSEFLGPQGSDLRIENNTIYYQNEPLHGHLVNRILNMLEQKDSSVQPLINFLVRLQTNPSYRVREQLFKFLDAGKNVITKDGKFLAYKKVREDFKDIYTGKMLNLPGTVVTMDRNKVDDDPNRTCSSGLHVCSYQYLNHFGNTKGNKVVVVEVDPKDVVSIPADYNDTKMRTCGYRVIKEIPLETWMDGDVLGTNSVVTDDDPWYDSGCSDYPEDYDDDDWISSSDNC